LKTTNVSLIRDTIVTCHVAVYFLNKKISNWHVSQP